MQPMLAKEFEALSPRPVILDTASRGPASPKLEGSDKHPCPPPDLITAVQEYEFVR